MILTSACLAGYKCRYDGQDNCCKIIIKMVNDGHAIPVCPEQLAGLPTPRTPCEIAGGDGADVLKGDARIITSDGRDLTHAFCLGAQRTLEICRIYDIKRALLKSNSPSCGCGRIYGGTFDKTLISGDGVTAALLKASGIDVISSDEIEKFILD